VLVHFDVFRLNVNYLGFFLSLSARHAIYDLAKMGKIFRTNPNDKGKGSVAKYDIVASENETEGEDD